MLAPVPPEATTRESKAEYDDDLFFLSCSHWDKRVRRNRDGLLFQVVERDGSFGPGRHAAIAPLSPFLGMTPRSGGPSTTPRRRRRTVRPAIF